MVDCRLLFLGINHTTRKFREREMAIATGTKFNQYEILAPLGAGGMGEVYRARDTRLNREVAIKVLPGEVAHDAERLRRFEQEARATSALNHPNILTVYDFGEYDGNPYLVMELLDGAELRAQMNNGGLPVRKAIDYAQQIAAGLAAAHEKHIVHRDLKPENLFITNDGRVKILDFGLAKLRGLRNADFGMRNEEADTLIQGAANPQSAIRNPQLTAPGTVMGTVAYMSPEQVRGQDLEQRSDIFSFGLILYEMLAGRRAFDRQSFAETMAAIANEDAPELSEVNSKVTPQLDRIVRHCLEKKPEMRFQSARDLGFALEALTTPNSSGKHRTEAVAALATTKRGGWRERIAWMVAALAVLTALGLAYFKPAQNDSRAVRLAFAPPENVAFDNWRQDSVVVSPDGQKLVFTGRSADGKRQLYVRQLASAEATPLPGTDDAYEPFWSPDSRSLGFAAQGKLKRIDIAGGRPQTLCGLEASSTGGAWNRAGMIIFGTASTGLFQVPETGGEPQPATIREPGTGVHNNPVFLPDGRHFLYRVGRGGNELKTFVGSLDSKEVKLLLPDAGPAVYAPPGWLLFVRNGALLAQAFDAGSQEFKGDAIPLTKPTDIAEVSGRPFSVSENGVLIWQGDRLLDYQLVWFDRVGKPIGTVGPPNKVSLGEQPQLSPDGTRVAVHRAHPQTRNFDIWIFDLTRESPLRLTTDADVDLHPVWSPDGRQVLFYSFIGGNVGVHRKAASGTGEQELLLKGFFSPVNWSADGRFVFCTSSSVKTRQDIWVLPLFGERQPWPLLNSEFAETQPQLSPDMHWLVYASDESGSYEIYVQPFTADGKLGSDKVRISTSGGKHPRFRRDGKELFYVATDGHMMAVALHASETKFEFEPPKALFKTRMLSTLTQFGIGYDVTSDGQRFLIGTQVGEPSPVSVILNWTEGLKK
jgi:Tol biopolymer transport system component